MQGEIFDLWLYLAYLVRRTFFLTNYFLSCFPKIWYYHTNRKKSIKETIKELFLLNSKDINVKLLRFWQIFNNLISFFLNSSFKVYKLCACLKTQRNFTKNELRTIFCKNIVKLNVLHNIMHYLSSLPP